MSYSVQNLSDVLESGGEEFAKALAAGFTCKHNKEIDDYLRDDAIDFTRRSMTITHLVFENETGVLLGYFALTHKPLTFVGDNLSANQRKRMERFAKINDGKYMVSAYLIAQIGKNYAEDDGRKISGKDLLDLAKKELMIAKRQVGGQVVFVEMEQGNESLEKFYKANGFVKFDSRESEEKGKTVVYDQLFLFLK